eukprot:9970419-Heterocapsa_arctica.AAC.1
MTRRPREGALAAEAGRSEAEVPITTRNRNRRNPAQTSGTQEGGPGGPQGSPAGQGQEAHAEG